MFYKAFLAACVASLLGLSGFSPAHAQTPRVQVGTLSCSISAGIGMIVASQRNVSCIFKPENGPQEAYTGTITRIGVDIGVTTGAVMVWGVSTSTNRYAGMLAGKYAGASAEATAVAGVGANVLLGGSNSSVALQPISVQGQMGLNIAAGIGALELHYAQ